MLTVEHLCQHTGHPVAIVVHVLSTKDEDVC